MFVKIEMGPGEPGKLWTGTPISGAKDKFAHVELVEFRSPESGACSRRLFFRELRDDAPEGILIPTLHISTGGVGSLISRRVTREHGGAPTTLIPENSWMMPLLVWNWSGRVGGYLILNPVRVESGYVRRDEINPALPGYAWIHTYDGNTLAEYVLVRAHLEEPRGGVEPYRWVDERHILPIHRIVNSRLSPPERDGRTMAEASEPPEAPEEIPSE